MCGVSVDVCVYVSVCGVCVCAVCVVCVWCECVCVCVCVCVCEYIWNAVWPATRNDSIAPDPVGTSPTLYCTWRRQQIHLTSSWNFNFLPKVDLLKVRRQFLALTFQLNCCSTQPDHIPSQFWFAAERSSLPTVDPLSNAWRGPSYPEVGRQRTQSHTTSAVGEMWVCQVLSGA